MIGAKPKARLTIYYTLNEPKQALLVHQNSKVYDKRDICGIFDLIIMKFEAYCGQFCPNTNPKLESKINLITPKDFK